MIIQLITIYILNLIDYWQTMWAVHLWGIGCEANPIGRYLIENDYIATVKITIVPILLIVLGAIVRKQRWLAWMVNVLLTYYGIIVAINFAVILICGL